MKIIIDITDDSRVRSYLRLWKSVFRLTDSEALVLEAIVNRYLKLQSEGVKDPYISDLLLNTKARKELQESVGYSENHFNNIVKALKDKKIISKIGDGYKIADQRVIPVSEITFKFVKND
jgi:hypothetical protein